MSIDKFVMQRLYFLDAKIALASDERNICTRNDRSLQLDVSVAPNEKHFVKKYK